MRRGTCRDLGLAYINEPRVSRFGEPVCNAALNLSAKLVQAEILPTSDRFWYAEGYFIWPSRARRVNLRERLQYAEKGEPWKFLSHGTLLSAGEVSDTNPVAPLGLCSFNRIGADRVASGYFPNAPGEAAYASASFSTELGQIAFQGDFAFANPMPMNQVYCYFEWVPLIPDIPDGTDYDNHEILGGQLPQFHGLVAIRLAIELQSMRQGNIDHLVKLYADTLQKLQNLSGWASKAVPQKIGGGRRE